MPRCRPALAASTAFTLVEMLVVIVVIVIIIGIAGPAVTAMKNAGDINKAMYDIAGMIEQSRTYAMSNNTYVYLGIEETDVSQSSSASPQTTGDGHFGRITVAAVATKDGTQGYNTTSLQNGGSWGTIYAQSFANNLSVIGKPIVFENLHMPANLGTTMPTTGGMARPALSNSNYSLGSPPGTSSSSITPFDYPVVSTSSLGTGKYSFTKVVQFDPQGIARLQTSDNPVSIVPYLEIDLQPTHGPTAPALPPPGTGTVAALQIDCMTGSVRIYRP